MVNLPSFDMTYKWDFEKIWFVKTKRNRIFVLAHTHTRSHTATRLAKRVGVVPLRQPSRRAIAVGMRVRPVETHIILFLTKIYDRRMINNLYETQKNRRAYDSQLYSVKIHQTKSSVHIIHFIKKRPRWK